MFRFIISIILLVILTSAYYFPITLQAARSVNSKTILAAIGLVMFIFYQIRKNAGTLPPNYVVLFLWSGVVSLIAFFSSIINNTPETAYATYFVSMFVWLLAAFVVVRCITYCHGYFNIELITNYLTAVCVCQCIIALLVEYVPAVETFVDKYFYMQQEYLKLRGVERMYGIGASLDTAGIRFSLVLAMITYVVTKNIKSISSFGLYTYTICFLIIAFVGNLMARTTIVGLAFSVLLLIYQSWIYKLEIDPDQVRVFSVFGTVALILIPIVVTLYNTYPAFYEKVRFGFEGVFSLFEKGEWDVGSNEQLENMIVWPDNLKTWIIGDGYFNNPSAIDPYYMGPITPGYYMNTDIGYLRFIFYFGVIGLLSFVTFIIQCGKLCELTWPGNNLLFKTLVLIGLTVWLKVATDVFLIFAIFLCLPPGVTNKNEATRIGLS